MLIPLPELDDRRWSDLVEESRALIPVLAPEWTDHNASDPGITVIELYAWLAEMDVFRANRVTDAARRRFLALVGVVPRPASPAQTVVAFQLAATSGAVDLPAGVELEVVDPAADAGSIRSGGTARDRHRVPDRERSQRRPGCPAGDVRGPRTRHPIAVAPGSRVPDPALRRRPVRRRRPVPGLQRGPAARSVHDPVCLRRWRRDASRRAGATPRRARRGPRLRAGRACRATARTRSSPDRRPLLRSIARTRTPRCVTTRPRSRGKFGARTARGNAWSKARVRTSSTRRARSRSMVESASARRSR